MPIVRMFDWLRRCCPWDGAHLMSLDGEVCDETNQFSRLLWVKVCPGLPTLRRNANFHEAYIWITQRRFWLDAERAQLTRFFDFFRWKYVAMPACFACCTSPETVRQCMTQTRRHTYGTLLASSTISRGNLVEPSLRITAETIGIPHIAGAQLYLLEPLIVTAAAFRPRSSGCLSVVAPAFFEETAPPKRHSPNSRWEGRATAEINYFRGPRNQHENASTMLDDYAGKLAPEFSFSREPNLAPSQRFCNLRVSTSSFPIYIEFALFWIMRFSSFDIGMQPHSDERSVLDFSRRCSKFNDGEFVEFFVVSFSEYFIEWCRPCNVDSRITYLEDYHTGYYTTAEDETRREWLESGLSEALEGGHYICLYGNNEIFLGIFTLKLKVCFIKISNPRARQSVFSMLTVEILKHFTIGNKIAYSLSKVTQS